MRERRFNGWRTVGMLVMVSASFCGFVHLANAESVYKCVGTDGTVAYQDHACAGRQAESHVEIAPPPPPSASPDYGHGSRESARAYAHASSAHAVIRERREIVSYECRAANGEVFYRHGSCPHQITADGAGTTSRKRSGGGSSSVSVTAEALPRGEVCRRMAAAGSIGRAGHERDENVSTYDRNLGRDPCRYF